MATARGRPLGEIDFVRIISFMASNARRLLFLVAWALGGCGGAQQGPPEAPPPPPLAMGRFLAVYGQKNLAALAAPDESLGDLEKAISTAQGDARRPLQLKAAVAHLLAAASAEQAADAEQGFRAADRLAGQAGRATDDPTLVRDTAFVRLWCAWQLQSRNTPRLLARFADEHGDAEDLGRVVWAIRGEMAFSAEQWDEAMTAFRELVGGTDDPLYVMSLYRTAQCMNRLGQGLRSRQVLREVRNLGCNLEAPDEIRYVAALAAVELGTPLVRNGAGQTLPSTCEASGER